MIRFLIIAATTMSCSTVFASETGKFKATTMSLITIGIKCGSVAKSDRVYKLTNIIMPDNLEELYHLKQISNNMMHKYDNELDTSQRNQLCQLARIAVDTYLEKLKI